MLTAKKDGREIAAMIMNEPVNGVIGIVQCMILGCQAYQAILCDDPQEHRKKTFDRVHEFMMEHDCDPNRYPHVPRLRAQRFS